MYIATCKIEISIVTDEDKSSLNSSLPLSAHFCFKWKSDFCLKYREHWQKKFSSHLSLGNIWSLRGWLGLIEPVKKGKFVTKIFFSDDVEWKICE